MSLVKRRSGHFKNSPWFNKLPRLVEGPPFGEGLSLSEKMYAQKFEKSESGWSLCNLKYAAYAMQGFRKHNNMQDDYQCVPNYTIGSEREPCASFAVYGGHGLRGHGVSSFCADTFLGSVYGRKAILTAKHVTTELMKANIHKTLILSSLINNSEKIKLCFLCQVSHPPANSHCSTVVRLSHLLSYQMRISYLPTWVTLGQSSVGITSYTLKRKTTAWL